jgi:hypothetical protein
MMHILLLLCMLQGGTAMSCIAVDAPVPLEVLDSIRKIPGVHNVTAISIGENDDPAFR